MALLDVGTGTGGTFIESSTGNTITWTSSHNHSTDASSFALSSSTLANGTTGNTVDYTFSDANGGGVTGLVLQLAGINNPGTGAPEHWDFTVNGTAVNLSTMIANGQAELVPVSEQPDFAGYDEAANQAVVDGTGISGSTTGDNDTVFIKFNVEMTSLSAIRSGNTAQGATDIFAEERPICFTNGTMIEVEGGEKLVDDLEIGDMVRTLDNGFQPVRFIYKRKMAISTLTRPVIFEKGAIGNDRELRVSQKHRISTTGLHKFGYKGMDANALIWAQGLINGTTVRIDMECKEVEYFHIMFDKHELVHTHGVVSESWQPHRRNLKRDKALREELLAIFPEINHKGNHNSGAAVRDTTYSGYIQNR